MQSQNFLSVIKILLCELSKSLDDQEN